MTKGTPMNPPSYDHPILKESPMPKIPLSKVVRCLAVATLVKANS